MPRHALRRFGTPGPVPRIAIVFRHPSPPTKRPVSTYPTRYHSDNERDDGDV